MDSPLRLLILGAHPDDAEYHAGGLATIYRRLGHVVKMVSVTDGRAGHHVLGGAELVARRRAEAAAAGAVIGAEYATWDFPDGRLTPSLAVRERIIGEIRSFAPDLVLTHRTCDYHPDHRAVGQAVEDSCYLLTVPNIVPHVPEMRKDPVVLYLPDRFTRPAPLVADVAIDVGAELETIVRMFACHASQVYEWLPFNLGILEQVPREEAARFAWLYAQYAAHLRPMADRCRERLVATYGAERGRAVEYAEAFEASEYAAPFDDAARRRLFPFLP
jgi:LmbE family N-acetylglucosaminyl deacetylase